MNSYLRLAASVGIWLARSVAEPPLPASADDFREPGPPADATSGDVDWRLLSAVVGASPFTGAPGVGDATGGVRVCRATSDTRGRGLSTEIPAVDATSDDAASLTSGSSSSGEGRGVGGFCCDDPGPNAIVVGGVGCLELIVAVRLALEVGAVAAVPSWAADVSAPAAGSAAGGAATEGGVVSVAAPAGAAAAGAVAVDAEAEDVVAVDAVAADAEAEGAVAASAAAAGTAVASGAAGAVADLALAVWRSLIRSFCTFCPSVANGCCCAGPVGG